MAIYNEFGYITIDDARIDETCNAYFKWKDLNTYISNNSHRGINMPDAISEPMGCYCLGYLWNRGDEVGDATDPNTGRKIEFKATSRFEGDLSSFGPKCVFDDLVFLRFKLDENLLYIYDLNINSEEFGKYLGHAMANLAAVADPSAIVIGGGVSKAGEVLIEYVEKNFKERAFFANKGTEFVLATLGNDAGICGAAKLILS